MLGRDLERDAVKLSRPQGGKLKKKKIKAEEEEKKEAQLSGVRATIAVGDLTPGGAGGEKRPAGEVLTTPSITPASPPVYMHSARAAHAINPCLFLLDDRAGDPYLSLNAPPPPRRPVSQLPRPPARHLRK